MAHYTRLYHWRKRWSRIKQSGTTYITKQSTYSLKTFILAPWRPSGINYMPFCPVFFFYSTPVDMVVKAFNLLQQARKNLKPYLAYNMSPTSNTPWHYYHPLHSQPVGRPKIFIYCKALVLNSSMVLQASCCLLLVGLHMHNTSSTSCSMALLLISTRLYFSIAHCLRGSFSQRIL